MRFIVNLGKNFFNNFSLELNNIFLHYYNNVIKH